MRLYLMRLAAHFLLITWRWAFLGNEMNSPCRKPRMIAAGFWDEELLLSGGCVVLVRVNLWLELVVPAE